MKLKNYCLMVIVPLVLSVTACQQQEDTVAIPAVSEPAPVTGSVAGMELTGMFRYMADAALFRDCRDDRTYPVAIEGSYLELERAYLNSGVEAGAEVMIKLRGRLLGRPSMAGENDTVSLIVDVFKVLLPDETCSPPVLAELTNTYWRLDSLNGNTVKTPEGMKQAHMSLTNNEFRVQGYTGCNNFFGGFTAGNDTLSFSALGSTRMACPEGMVTERDFLAALGNTTHFKISGLFLEFYANEQLLARLEAMYF